MEKKCTKCGVVKSLDEFYNRKDSKDGKQFRCKICNKKYKENNREKVNKYSKEYYKEYNKEYKEYNKEYYKKNKEYYKEYNKEYKKKNKKKSKIYYQKNKERLIEYNKKWRENNTKKRDTYRKEYTKLRKETDLLFRLRCIIKCNVRTAIKNQGYTKNTKTFNILKCDYDFFMQWINGIASNDYTYGIGNLHLDHVVPISLAQTEDEAYLLNHYSNYQLLSADENLAKSNRYVNPTNLKRVLEHHPNPDKIREIHARL